MTEFNISYTGGGRQTPPVWARDHLSAITKSAKESLGVSYFKKHCKIVEIEPKTWPCTYFIVTDGQTEKYFAMI